MGLHFARALKKRDAPEEGAGYILREREHSKSVTHPKKGGDYILREREGSKSVTWGEDYILREHSKTVTHLRKERG